MGGGARLPLHVSSDTTNSCRSNSLLGGGDMLCKICLFPCMLCKIYIFPCMLCKIYIFPELGTQQFFSFATTTTRQGNIASGTSQGPEKNWKIVRPQCLDGVATIHIVKWQLQTTLWPDNMDTLSRQNCRVPSFVYSLACYAKSIYSLACYAKSIYSLACYAKSIYSLAWCMK